MTTADSAGTGHPAERAGAGTQRILRMAQGYLSTAVIIAALELGVFDVVATGARTSGAVADEIGADARGVRVLLDALSALDLLSKSDGEYSLTPAADAHLVTQRGAYLGDVVRAYVDRYTYAAMGHLADAVRRGGGGSGNDVDTPTDSGRWARMATGLATVSNPAAPAMLDALAHWAGDRRELDVLDLGCGSAALGLSVVRAFPTARLTGVDAAGVLHTARANAERTGVVDRSRWIAGDLFDVALDERYDLVILSQVLHVLSDEQVARALARVAALLRPGGHLVVHDYMARSETPRADPAPYLLSTVLLATTPAGETRSLEEHTQACAAAGLTVRDVRPVAGIPTHLLVAVKSPSPAD